MPAAFLLKLLGVWGWVKSGLSWLLSAAKKHPAEAALICALIACAWLNYGKGKALAERDQARAQIVALVKASDDNRKAAEEQVRQQQAAFDRAAKESQDEYEIQLGAFRSRAGVYAASHRLRAGQAYQCAPATSGQGDTPPSDNGPGADAIVVSRNDFDIFVENSVRLQQVHEWGESLQAKGLAIPAVDLSK